VENLTLTGEANINGTGNTLDNIIIGNTGNNTLAGAGGNDTLDGGDGNDVLNGGIGADKMTGGVGNDTYVVDDVLDQVIEAPGEGTDTVRSSLLNYTLTPDVERLTLTGGADINGTGNILDNIITGNSGNNILDGGVGADILKGGGGNDTYIVDNTGDNVQENLGAGTDTVLSSVNYTLTPNVENLTLTNGAISGTGNDLDNIIIGNGEDNFIDGRAGADKMAGGSGNDTYIVDNVGDIITELAGGGNDAVRSSVTYTLSPYVDNLTLTGTSNINGTGNSDKNKIIGNSGNNIIDGGAGADKMTGGGGNDTYIVDNAGDIVTELPGGGIDTVKSSVDYTLVLNVEKLTLTGTATTGTGNGLNNTITGNTESNTLAGGDGNDTIYGGDGYDFLNGDNGNDILNGGSGIDFVQGGLGADQFQFNSLADGIDSILDFSHLEVDKIGISALGFGSGLAKGVLNNNQFVLGATANGNGSPQFLYENATGLLRFDADGLAGGAAVFGSLNQNLNLNAADFIINA
jgi:trimeric autotransporter adhesin